jgi:tetratricopeptide (TPR) repeat protein
LLASFYRKLPGLALSFLLFTGIATAQTSQIEGVVKGEDGQPLKDAVIKIERKDIKGNYKTKTKKKGDYIHAGLPLGTYKITVEVEGKDRDTVDNVRTRLGEPSVINFDLQAMKAKQAALQQAAETGQLTQEQAREMTPEQRAAMEKQVKERAAALAKNKALNDAFNAGKTALDAKQYDEAIAQFTKASEMDPKQNVVWSNLAEAYINKAKTTAAPADREAALAKGIETYQKAIELAPNDAGYYNNYALALAQAKKFDEMRAAIDKAVSINPAGAGQYYFNLGAILTNTGQTGPACDAFKKAIDTDPNYAEAHFQYGVCLSAKGTARPDGTVVYPPEMGEAFNKYLAIAPTGPNAEAAKAMIAQMGGKVDAVYTAPGAKKPTTPRKK